MSKPVPEIYMAAVFF